MPLTNAFLWITLLLMVLLGYQLINSYHRAERKAYRRMSALVQRPSAAAGRKVQGSSQGIIIKASSRSGFLSVGRSADGSVVESISFALPSGQYSSSSIHQQEKAAVSDCQSCA